uniref:Uncharacterized protein n=1 Tax=Ditylenchus dipsaci TaxID=166011 RepID=A0A915EBB1_9BILA
MLNTNRQAIVSQSNNCTGNACILYESGDNKTSSAFCLLTTFSVNDLGQANSNVVLKNGCWLEPDGRSKHCICTTDFCNRLRDRTHKTEYDPQSPPLPELEFLKQSPFIIDYEYIDDEKGIVDNSSAKRTLSANKLDVDKISELQEDSIDEEDDLVPVDFDSYQDEWRQKESNRVLDNKVKPSPSSITNNNRYEVTSTDKESGGLENSAFKLSSFTICPAALLSVFHLFFALL